MAPRSSQEVLAAEFAPRATTPAKTFNLVFLYNGNVGMCEEVDPKMSVMRLRLVVKKTLQLNSHPMKIHLFSLRQADGSWPNEDAVVDVQGTEAKYTWKVARQFPGLSDDDEVHFRVELEEEEPPAGGERDVDAVSDAEAFVKDMNEAVSQSSKRRFPSETLPFHMFDADTVAKMYKRIKVETYTQRGEVLPEKLMQSIKKRYKENYNAAGPFNRKNEAGKRLYIDSILMPCVAWMNTKYGLQGNDRLDVSMEVQLVLSELNCSGRADYVVSKGSRNLIVVEAKDTNVPKGTSQTKATMEAARMINKRINRRWNTIRAICTDMQNWTFLERESGVVREAECLTRCNPRSPDFPEDLWNMVKGVYAMLVDL